MYKIGKRIKSQMATGMLTKGETIEQKMERIVTNKEPIKDGAPEIYTEKKDGVLQAYNIRTDRWEVACEAMDVATKSQTAKATEKAKAPTTEDTPEGGQSEINS